MSKKILFAAFMMMSLPHCSLQVNAVPAPVTLEVGYIDPKGDQGGPSRGPVLVPEIDIEDYTLSFDTSCYGCTLTLLDENGEVAYTTVVTSSTLVLPSTLSGEYEIQLIPASGDYYFYGYVLF